VDSSATTCISREKRGDRRCFRTPDAASNRFCGADPSWTFVFPTTVLRIPYSLLCAVVWTAVVYYVTGRDPPPPPPGRLPGITKSCSRKQCPAT